MLRKYTADALSDGVAWMPVGYTKVHYDFDTEVSYFAHWFIAPLALAFWWWDTKRWVIERWMRWRITDLPSGFHCGLWRLGLRKMNQWSLSRTRPHSLSPEYREIQQRILAAYEKSEKDRTAEALGAVRNYINNSY